MHQRIYYIVPFLLLVTSCKKDAILNTDDQQQIVSDCIERSYSTQIDIENNLIGSWHQISYRCGGCTFQIDPSSTITFEKSIGTLHYETDQEKTQLNFTWQIVSSTDRFQNEIFRLQTEPIHYALRMNTFCNEYMFFDDRFMKGAYFLYQKQ